MNLIVLYYPFNFSALLIKVIPTLSLFKNSLRPREKVAATVLCLKIISLSPNSKALRYITADTLNLQCITSQNGQH